MRTYEFTTKEGKQYTIRDHNDVYTPALIDLLTNHPNFLGDIPSGEVVAKLNGRPYGIRFSSNWDELFLCAYITAFDKRQLVQIQLGPELKKFSYNKETKQFAFKAKNRNDEIFVTEAEEAQKAGESAALSLFVEIFQQYPRNFPPMPEELELPQVKKQLEKQEKENQELVNQLAALKKENANLRAQLGKSQPNEAHSPVLFRRV